MYINIETLAVKPLTFNNTPVTLDITYIISDNPTDDDTLITKAESTNDQGDMALFQRTKKIGLNANTNNIKRNVFPMMAFFRQNNYGLWPMKLGHKNHYQPMARPRWG